MEGARDPGAPSVAKATGLHNAIKPVPRNRIESLPEIQFEDSSWGLALMTAAEKVGGINKVFSDVSAMDETSLIRINQVRDAVGW